MTREHPDYQRGDEWTAPEFPAAAHDAWKTTDPRDWPSVSNGERKGSRGPDACGFCVSCGAGLTAAESRRVPMRCAGCTPFSPITHCWRCGKRFLTSQCTRCDLGLDAAFIAGFAAERGISMRDSELMLVRNGVPPRAADDDITF